MTAFTVRLPDETVTKLDKLAATMDRPRAYLAAQAIEDYVQREAWQLADIKAGLSEAEAGMFAHPEEVNGVIGKYSIRNPV